MRCTQTNKGVNMIFHPTHGMGNSTHVPDNAAHVFMHSCAMRIDQPSFTLLRAEDEVVVEGKVRGRHGGRFLAPLQGAIGS